MLKKTRRHAVQWVGGMRPRIWSRSLQYLMPKSTKCNGVPGLFFLDATAAHSAERCSKTGCGVNVNGVGGVQKKKVGLRCATQCRKDIGGKQPRPVNALRDASMRHLSLPPGIRATPARLGCDVQLNVDGKGETPLPCLPPALCLPGSPALGASAGCAKR